MSLRNDVVIVSNRMVLDLDDTGGSASAIYINGVELGYITDQPEMYTDEAGILHLKLDLFISSLQVAAAPGVL